MDPNIFLGFSYISIIDGPAFIIMDPATCNLRDLLCGKKPSLAERLRDQPFSTLHDTLGLASALEWLHSHIPMEWGTWRQFLHMDINPSNILVFSDEPPGRAWKITDFGGSVSRGIWRWSDPKSSKPWITTATQRPRGYCAPQVEYAPNKAGYATEVWSFGCILMEVLAFLIGGPSKVRELQLIWGRFGSFYETQGDHSLQLTIRNWLIEIVEKYALPWQCDCRDLIFDILQGRKDRRPSASKVYATLQDISRRRANDKLTPSGNQHRKKVKLVDLGIQTDIEVKSVSRGIQSDIEVDLPVISGPDTPSPSPTTEGSTLDLMKIKRWLDSCEESPAKQAEDGTAAIIGLYESLELHSRVIDVIRLRVVPAPKRCRYVALSYVWGGRQRWALRGTNERFFRNDGTVEPKRCSKSIWDAILLCQAIGERYLWVDALCIVQDTEDKHAQIQAMEAIYRGAVLTIVAAAGEHADAGLPGVSNTPRHSPNFGDQQGHEAANSFDTAVNSSVWNTRAWTYQERIISQRLVVFTTEQVFFHCSHGIACEIDGEDPHDALLLRRDTQSAQLDSSRLELERKINFNTYAQITQEYTKRILTHEDDIENAFEGIKKIISLLFISEITFCVPIAALDVSLLWYPAKNTLQRRCVETADNRFQSLFPSWSWAGWVGPVYYKDLVNISERTISRVTWRQSEDGLALDSNGFGKNTPYWPPEYDWLRQVTPEGRLYYIRRNGNPSHWFCHPVARFIHDSVPLDRKTGHLIFSADKAQPVSWRMKRPEPSSSNTLRILHRKTGRQLGKVIMHMRYDPKEEYEYLKISSTTLTDGDKDPAWRDAKARFEGTPGGPALIRLNVDTSSASEWFDPEAYDPTVCFCLYNVLVTVMRGGVTYRVGIGKIHIHAFDEVAVRDQLVRLGSKGLSWRRHFVHV